MPSERAASERQTISLKSQAMLSTPPLSATKTGSTEYPTPSKASSADMLSPPITPAGSAEGHVESRIPSIDLERPGSPSVPKIYGGSFRIHHPIGRGAWSNVSLAEEASIPASTSTTPFTRPLTPPTTPHKHASRLVAIKAPAHNMARKVLLQEAHTLTVLSALPCASAHIVPFYGFHTSTSSLVLGYIPLTLSTFIHSHAHPLTAPSDPIIGLPTWLSLATSLISSLGWLHSHGFIHGDIKPANILLSISPHSSQQSLDTGTMQPVLADFSSTRPTSCPTPSRTDALTTAYAAPELLASMRAGGGAPTVEADVWALGSTLLCAGTGEEPYASAGRNDMRRLAMAREGDVLASVEDVRRVKKAGWVESGLNGATTKVESRWSVEDWKTVMAGIVEQAERLGGGRGDSAS